MMLTRRRERRRTLLPAAQASRAAALVLRDRRCDPTDALPLLIRGWERLGVSSEADTGEQLELLQKQGNWSRRELRRERAALARAVRRAGGPGLRLTGRLWGVATAGVLLLAVAGLATFSRAEVIHAVSSHGWRGAYHPDLLFLGEPRIRRDPQVRFRWDLHGPMPELPPDNFSVRWDTCLKIPRDLTMEMRLGSDDGSRLYVDGERVVDNWGDHAFRWRSAAKELSAGTHHVIIEYYDKGRDARVDVRLIVPGGEDRPVPLSWLEAPTRPHDADDVCAE